ncbi:MAG: hypothetical protein IT534_11465 [Bauldia sp.]|nr:hypothetical protein [Bauldia sp.]
MPTDIIIWSAATHSWRTVRRPDPHGPMHFDPLDAAMTGELARRSFVSAMRFAGPPGSFNGPSVWQPAASDWDD